MKRLWIFLAPRKIQSVILVTKENTGTADMVDNVLHSNVPYGNEGSGFFSDNNIGNFDVIEAATPMVLNALENVPVKDVEKPFIICDFGTADGGTSMFLFKKMIGGRMVVINSSLDKEGQSTGNTKNIKEALFHNFNKYWKEMVTEGEITQEEFDNTNFNMYFRTIEECSAPFCDPNSAVSKSGLNLIAIEIKVVRCPFHEKWTKSGEKGDQEAAANHARLYVQAIRAWSNSTFLSGLDSSRSEEEKAAIVDKFFLKYEKAVASAPEDHWFDNVHSYIDIEKM